MQPTRWPPEYSLPLQPPRSAPHHYRSSSTHPSSAPTNPPSSSLPPPHLFCASFTTEPSFGHGGQTPRGSLAELGVLPDAAERRRLSRDDTASSVSEPLQDAAGSQLIDNESAISNDSSAWLDRTQNEDARVQRQQRRSVFTLPSSLTSAAEGSAVGKQSVKLGRRLTRSFRDNVTKYASTSRTRRASTPQGIGAGSSQLPKFTSTPVPPTSPSKRNGTGDSDRPTKLTLNRNFLRSDLKSDRKDTPAPPPLTLNRPASRSAAATMAFGMPGGDQARQAAAASKPPCTPLLSGQTLSWNAQDDHNTRRSQVLSLRSAADSGADLSSYSGSEVGKDLDGDVDMSDAGSIGVEEARDPIALLPLELGLHIFEFLDCKDIKNAERVSRRWHTVASDTAVWRSAYLRAYGRQIYTNPPPIQVGGAGCGRVGKPKQEWKRMFKARLALDKNWRRGPAGAGKAVYLAGHTDSVYCVQFDEEKIITGSRDRTIRVWDITNFTCLKVIGGPHVRPTPGPKVLRTVDYPDFHLATASVNATSYGNSIYHTPSQWHDASILCLQYDHEILVTGSSDSDLIVWDIKTYEPIKRLQKHSGGVLDVALDAKHIVSCSKDSKIIVWDRATLQPKGELCGHRGPVNAVQMRGNQLVSASGDGIARLWDIEKMKLIKEFSAKERGLAAVEFSEDMKHVLAGGNDTITYKFETDTGKEVQQFTGHTQLVRSLWLDSQNSRVVSGSYDLDLRVYDFNTGDELWRAEEWTTSWMLAAKSDYRRIVATSQDGRILIVDFGLNKSIHEDDGQPIKDLDLLRGLDDGAVPDFGDPFKIDRERRKEQAKRLMRMFGWGQKHAEESVKLAALANSTAGLQAWLDAREAVQGDLVTERMRLLRDAPFPDFAVVSPERVEELRLLEEQEARVMVAAERRVEELLAMGVEGMVE